MHQDIGDAFRKVYGPHAGWAHQILFAGDLAQFQEKVKDSKKRKIDQISPEDEMPETKRRKI